MISVSKDEMKEIFQQIAGCQPPKHLRKETEKHFKFFLVTIGAPCPTEKKVKSAAKGDRGILLALLGALFKIAAASVVQDVSTTRAAQDIQKCVDIAEVITTENLKGLWDMCEHDSGLFAETLLKFNEEYMVYDEQDEIEEAWADEANMPQC